MSQLSSESEAPDAVANRLLRTWQYLGVRQVFTVPGGPLVPFLAGCQQRQLDVVICRHETGAAFMAAAYYHEARRPAVLALTSGPGAANAVNGIYYALREQAALLIVSARPASHKLGKGAIQDLDTARVFAGMTKRSEQLLHGLHCEWLAQELFLTACAPAPGPVNLTLCADLWGIGLEVSA